MNTETQKRRVQVHGIHLSRLIYLTKEEFKVLEGLMVLRVLKSLEGLMGVLKFKVLKKSNLVVKGKRDNRYHCQGSRHQSCVILERIFHRRNRKSNIIARSLRKEGNIDSCYEPTNIAWTRESLFWGWRRVKEYCLDLLEEERYRNLVKEAKKLAYS